MTEGQTFRGAVALDVYGTLVDPLQMDERLERYVGGKAGEMSALWRQKQLEYTFRLGLMGVYRDFGFCTERALWFAAETFEVELSDEDRKALISAYQDLRSFPDAVPGIEALKRRPDRAVVAFSNGVPETTETLLERAGVMQSLDGVVSVDPVQTFKPDPAAYRHLCDELSLPPDEIWVVSSNPFDVIGARSFGIKAAWVRRSSQAVFDPWDLEPDLVVSDLEELARELG